MLNGAKEFHAFIEHFFEMSAQEKRFDVVGKNRRRVDGRAKATGQTQFADDLVLPRMLHCKMLRSPHPHAVIEEILTAKAAKHPGVHLVLTGKDFPVPFGFQSLTSGKSTGKSFSSTGCQSHFSQ